MAKRQAVVVKREFCPELTSRCLQAAVVSGRANVGADEKAAVLAAVKRELSPESGWSVSPSLWKKVLKHHSGDEEAAEDAYEAAMRQFRAAIELLEHCDNDVTSARGVLDSASELLARHRTTLKRIG